MLDNLYWGKFSLKGNIMKKLIAMICISFLLSACATTNTYKKKEGEWIGWGEKNRGYTEEKITSDRWQVRYHAKLSSKDADVLKLLYKRVDEFGGQVCSKGFQIDSQRIENDYAPLGGSPIGKVASVMLMCK